jgi:hypothetical protein
MQIKAAVGRQCARGRLGETGRFEPPLAPDDHVWISGEIEIRICLHARFASGPAVILRPLPTRPAPAERRLAGALVAWGKDCRAGDAIVRTQAKEHPMERVTIHRSRARWPLVIAVIAAAATLALSVRQSDADTHHPMQMATNTATVTRHQLAFRNQMRGLWEQHVAWTRLAIVSFAGSLPDLSATEQRLLRNQRDIGDAVVPYYGQTAGHQLTILLRHHILIAVDILVDAKSGDQAALAVDLKRWSENANQIAAFLHRANPDNWTLAEMRRMMQTHLKLTTDEAVAQLTGDFPASIQAYDRIEREILRMADMLSTGIIAQFPGRFS